jgi:phospholipid/cholesterol/gamma-HCH transport system substrate-binding protein
MRSRALREGSVGLLILLGAGLFAAVVLWLRGVNPGRRTYDVTVNLPNASGVDIGSSVRYRGVKVGTVTALKTDTDQVKVVATIVSDTLLIPRNSTIETTQSGFIGQVYLDVRPPLKSVSSAQVSGLTPFGDSCNQSLILCDGDQLRGNTGASFDELIRSTTSIANLLNDSQLIANANQTLKQVNQTAADISVTAKGANLFLQDARTLTRDARTQLQTLGTAGTSVTKAANEVTALVQTNRATIQSALTNLDAAGRDLRVAINSLDPVLNRLEKGQLLDNLDALASNGAEAAKNLKSLSATLNNPITVLGLAQTLDAARKTFLNTQQITNELLKVTGDEEFRKRVNRLLRGLNKLMSSTQELEQQMQAVSSPSSETQPEVTQTQPTVSVSVSLPQPAQVTFWTSPLVFRAPPLSLFPTESTFTGTALVLPGRSWVTTDDSGSTPLVPAATLLPGTGEPATQGR